jgi:hypothetical protein
MREDEEKQRWVAEAVIRSSSTEDAESDSIRIATAGAKTQNEALNLLQKAVSLDSAYVQELQKFLSSLPDPETAD